MPARDASSNDKQSLSDRVLGALLKPGAPSPVTPQGTAELEHETAIAGLVGDVLADPDRAREGDEIAILIGTVALFAVLFWYVKGCENV